MLSPTLSTLGAVVMGFAQGYVAIPTLLWANSAVHQLGSIKPGMERHVLSRAVSASVFVGYVLLAHGAVAIAWLDRLSTLSALGSSVSGRYWAVAAFGGMVVFAAMPHGKAADDSASSGGSGS